MTSSIDQRNMHSSLTERLRNRFTFFQWPLTLFEESIELRKESLPLDEKTKKTKYPIRVLRYWWVICAIQDEMRRLGHPPVIADMGCDRALFKRLLPPIEGAHVIGLDREQSLESHSRDIDLAKYDEVRPCDLDVGIPLDDSSVDIVVFLHVIEHLPRPEFAVRELVRIIRPGGMLLMGVPVLPKLLAQIREKQYSKEFLTKTRVSGQHQNRFWPRRIRNLVEETGLSINFMIGTYLLRKRGAFWENSSLWVRINQLWGALFPSLSQELCLQLRKPSVLGVAATNKHRAESVN